MALQPSSARDGTGSRGWQQVAPEVVWKQGFRTAPREHPSRRKAPEPDRRAVGLQPPDLQTRRTGPANQGTRREQGTFGGVTRDPASEVVAATGGQVARPASVVSGHFLSSAV